MKQSYTEASPSSGFGGAGIELSFQLSEALHFMYPSFYLKLVRKKCAPSFIPIGKNAGGLRTSPPKFIIFTIGGFQPLPPTKAASRRILDTVSYIASDQVQRRLYNVTVHPMNDKCLNMLAIFTYYCHVFYVLLPCILRITATCRGVATPLSLTILLGLVYFVQVRLTSTNIFSFLCLSSTAL